MRKSRVILGAVLGALIVAALMPAAALGISREAILARGRVWVIKKVPYSQTRYATVEGARIPTTSTVSPWKLGYRTDCSGFVSMSLGLTTSGGFPLSHSTATFSNVLTTIPKSEMRPGDVIMRPSTGWPYGHAVLFRKWANAKHTAYWSYEESGSNRGAISRRVTYPFFGAAGFRPYRYSQFDVYYPDCQESVQGPDGYGTAVAASRMAFPATVTVTAKTLVVTNGESWTGNLAGAALASACNGPLLLTSKGSLPATAFAAIKRLSPDLVYVIGGPSQVSTAVIEKINTWGIEAVRITGHDRYATAGRAAVRAVSMARAESRTVDTAYLVGSEAFSDGVAASPIAAKTGRPILLTRRTTVPAATFDALKKTGIKRVFVLGNSHTISVDVVWALRSRGITVARLGGSNRYKTALLIARHGAGIRGAGLSWKRVGLVSSGALGEAFACGVAQGQVGSLVLLTPGTALYSGASAEIATRRASIGMLRILGNYNVIGLTARRSAHWKMLAQ